MGGNIGTVNDENENEPTNSDRYFRPLSLTSTSEEIQNRNTRNASTKQKQR